MILLQEPSWLPVNSTCMLYVKVHSFVRFQNGMECECENVFGLKVVDIASDKSS